MVATGATRPQQDSASQPRPEEHFQSNAPVEVEQHGGKGEKRHGIAPNVLPTSMKKGHGQDAYQAFGAKRPVAKSVQPQVELEIDEKSAPHQNEAADGDNQRMLNAPLIGLQLLFHLFRRRAMLWHARSAVGAPRAGTGCNGTATRGRWRRFWSGATGLLGPVRGARAGAGSAAEIGVRRGIHMIVWKRTHSAKLGRKSRNYFATANLKDNERYRTHSVDFSVGRSR